MLPGFLGQLQKDFESIVAADFAEEATVSDGTTTITLPCMFDQAVQHFDPESQSYILYAGSRMTVAETMAQGFNLRQAGLAVTVRGQNFTIRGNDWEFDGLGQLVIYLNKA